MLPHSRYFYAAQSYLKQNRKVLFQVILISIFLTACKGAGHAGKQANRPKSKQALLSVEYQWVQDLLRNDVPSLKHILAPDFTNNTYKGRFRNRITYLKETAAPNPKGIQMHLKKQHVRIYGRTGVVTGINIISATKPSFKVRIRFTDVFVKSTEGWKAVAAQETLVQ